MTKQTVRPDRFGVTGLAAQVLPQLECDSRLNGAVEHCSCLPLNLIHRYLSVGIGHLSRLSTACASLFCPPTQRSRRSWTAAGLVRLKYRRIGHSRSLLTFQTRPILSERKGEVPMTKLLTTPENF